MNDRPNYVPDIILLCVDCQTAAIDPRDYPVAGVVFQRCPRCGVWHVWGTSMDFLLRAPTVPSYAGRFGELGYGPPAN